MNVPEVNPGEVYAGATTSPAGVSTHIFLLPETFKGPWEKAMAWAAKLGGELPDRVESALLFANCKNEFEPTWHWTREELDDAFAWSQTFGNGYQSYYHKGNNDCRARAVRRLIIE